MKRIRKDSFAKRQRNKRKCSVMLCTVFFVMLFGITVYAGEKYNSDTYDGHYLNCVSICEKSYGTGKTNGAVKPYYNYAAVIIYGQDGKSQGSTYAVNKNIVGSQEARLTSVAKVKGSNLKSATTYHALVNESGGFTDSFVEQLVYSVDR